MRTASDAALNTMSSASQKRRRPDGVDLHDPLGGWEAKGGLFIARHTQKTASVVFETRASIELMAMQHDAEFRIFKFEQGTNYLSQNITQIFAAQVKEILWI